MSEAIFNFLKTTGVYQLFWDEAAGAFNVSSLKTLVMYVIIGALFYLAIVKKFEPLLLMPIAFGMLLANLPGANLIHLEYFFDEYYIGAENGKFIGTLAAQLETFKSGVLGNYPPYFSFGEAGDVFSLNMGCCWWFIL